MGEKGSVGTVGGVGGKISSSSYTPHTPLSPLYHLCNPNLQSPLTTNGTDKQKNILLFTVNRSQCVGRVTRLEATGSQHSSVINSKRDNLFLRVP
ncbi:MAG: hypothetical protein V7K47_13105 [Nostoc sp.]